MSHQNISYRCCCGKQYSEYMARRSPPRLLQRSPPRLYHELTSGEGSTSARTLFLSLSESPLFCLELQPSLSGGWVGGTRKGSPPTPTPRFITPSTFRPHASNGPNHRAKKSARTPCKRFFLENTTRRRGS